LHALANAVGKIADDDTNNQNTFVSLGVTVQIVTLTRLKNKEIQTTAVEAIHKLANNNPETQKIIVGEKIPELLLKLLKDSRAEQVPRHSDPIKCKLSDNVLQNCTSKFTPIFSAM
jgi:hypothetical protein